MNKEDRMNRQNAKKNYSHTWKYYFDSRDHTQIVFGKYMHNTDIFTLTTTCNLNHEMIPLLSISVRARFPPLS